MKRKIIASVLTFMMVMSACPSVYAATEHYNDSSKTGDAESWQAYKDNWETLSSDYTQVSITPGQDETELNFAWYSEKTDSEGTPVVHFGTDQEALETFEGTVGDVDTSLTGDKAYEYNHVTVTGIQPSTTYYYTVERNGEQSEVVEYTTQSLDSVKILYVGDPQIGASVGQPQDGGELAAESGAGNTAALNDGFAWDRTLDAAVAENPDLSFVISAGDQVNKTGQPKEEEYAAYLSADALKTLPVATTIGNHDSLNPDYTYHFNNPNATEYGTTEAGGDYYYSYGDGLFIVLNTNNYNVAEHKQAIEEAIAAYPDAAWRVVTIHQDIYGSGLDHSDTDGMILRTQLTPVFDEADIDVVLQGHDHTYSRSKLLYGDGQTHSSYEFRLNEEGTDYDWDHAYNVETDEQIPLYPEDGDEEGAAAKDAFTQDNMCYTIEDVEGNTVTDPQGILYMTANSASGSKYYELTATQQDYIAARSQNWLPSFSVITMDSDSFQIDTYQITDDGTVEQIDETFTIEKTAGAADETATDAAAEDETSTDAAAEDETSTDAAADETATDAAAEDETAEDAAAEDTAADETTEDAAAESTEAAE
ncbi:MAG TPA: metallophosphoesterase [Candidatus Blautia faecavium]|uniref:Metallophosphoesterase n=1 Tax=Candidatus Blautia faecavium TaxID=2838487 RepID=A0A9D2LW30_9FIRM|nr:metallophosphoesterase [Candidatus Blautia faecavium]